MNSDKYSQPLAFTSPFPADIEDHLGLVNKKNDDATCSNCGNDWNDCTCNWELDATTSTHQSIRDNRCPYCSNCTCK
uniref:Uncharacterized protein n=1 Tax=Ditylenchus dipsaci TaxID=166011 RepID=A0A915DPX3_9BILA